MLGLYLVVSLFHLRLDPLSERVANDCVYYVCNILARQLVHLLLDWEIFVDSRILFGENLHVFDGQALKLWNIDVLDILGLDAFLRSRLDVSEMPYRDVLERWQKDIHLRCEEPIDLTLALEFCRKLSGCHLLILVEDLSLSSPRRYLT